MTDSINPNHYKQGGIECIDAINKPGGVNQNPYYDCAGCYDYQTHRAEDLRTHKDRAWCDSCWDCHKDEALPHWHELERFAPALQAECEKLRNLLRHAQPIITAHAEASHMLEGFRPKRNQWDELVEEVSAAIHDDSQ